jgi:ABC-type nitrate/sulfonate/bicarbonate transport system substrate-binding protein
VAHELGFFEREGLATVLQRQPGWASVRDKMLYGAIDVAHAPGGFLYAINAGATPNVGRCCSAFIMSAQGNAITISRRLYDRGIRHAEDFPAEVRARRPELLTFGIVSQHSSHAHLLRGWLKRGGINPKKDLRIVVLPPQQMVASLAAGHIDGFCAGEPWNTLAVSESHGWVAADSAALTPMHPEKVVLVHEDFALEHHDEHMGLLRAQRAACEWSAQAANHASLAKLLLRWVFVDVAEKVLLRSLASSLAPIFTGPELHAPSRDKATWILGEMRQHDLLPEEVEDAELLAGFRPDLYALLKLDHAAVSSNA